MPLPDPVPDLAALDLLVSVGELGSISAAARAHRITQPAASMRLRTLERVLGLQLLDRVRPGARLTPAGAATAEWSGAVLADMRELLSGTAALRSHRRTHLRLAASMTVAEYLVPGWLARLATDLPEVEVALVMGNSAHVVHLLTGGKVDLGFIEGPGPATAGERLHVRELRRDELVVVVGRDHPWAHRRRPIDPPLLASTPLLLREQGSGTRDVLASALGALGLDVRPSMELGSTTAIKAAAIAGSGPAVLSTLAVDSEVRAGHLVVVACPGLDLSRSLRAVWPGSSALPKAAAHLVTVASELA